MNETLLHGPALPAWARKRTGDTLVELLERSVQRFGPRVAIVIARGRRLERWTYSDLGRASTRAAQELAARGVRRGDRVVTWSANDPALVAVFFGAWRLGAAIVPLDLRMAPDVSLRIAAHTQPSLVIAGRAQADLAARLGAPVAILDDLELLSSPAEADSELPAPPDASVIAEILFTSGTTSDPKGVALTHAALIHSARAIAVTAGVVRERALSFIPLSHMYGQIVPLFLGLLSGSQVTFLPSLTPQVLFETLRRDRITAITAVPHVMQLLVDAIEREAARSGRSASLRRARALAKHLPMRLRRGLFRSVLGRLGGSLRIVTSGGARLTPDLQAAFEDMGVLVVQGYGATECAAISGHSRASRRAGNVGPPLAEIEVRLADDRELLVRGPNMMIGYWHRPEETAEALASGWVHTGDAASFVNGEIVIHGRTRDRIALPNGLKVYPDDVETALRAQPAIRDAVVIEGEPGQLVAVLLTEAAAGDAELGAAVKQANENLAPHQRARRWLRWPEQDLPRTHTLKVRRATVQAWVDAGARAGPSAGSEKAVAGRDISSPGGQDDIINEIVGAFADTLKRTRGESPAGLAGATRLDELDLDSLTLVALALELEDRIGVALEVDEIAAVETVGGLAELVAMRGSAPVVEREPSHWPYSLAAVAVRELIGFALIRPALRMIASPVVVGRENLAALDGPVLICGNHTSHLDAPLILASLPAGMRRRTAIAAAADYFFDRTPILGSVTALSFGAFPFGRIGRVRASLERVSAHLDAGRSVILFPEGTRSATGRPGPFLEGVGLLATDFGHGIVPVHISGAHALLPKGASRPRRGQVTIRFGPLIAISPTASISEATATVASAVEALQPERLAQ